MAEVLPLVASIAAMAIAVLQIEVHVRRRCFSHPTS